LAEDQLAAWLRHLLKHLAPLLLLACTHAPATETSTEVLDGELPVAGMNGTLRCDGVVERTPRGCIIRETSTLNDAQGTVLGDGRRCALECGRTYRLCEKLFVCPCFDGGTAAIDSPHPPCD
jgi:hypothetical protein